MCRAGAKIISKNVQAGIENKIIRNRLEILIQKTEARGTANVKGEKHL